MKNKFSTLIAWVIFGAISIGTLIQLVAMIANLEPVQDVNKLVSNILWTFVPVVFSFLAALIVSRQNGNLIGWLLMLPAIGSGSDVLGVIFKLPATPTGVTPLFLLILWYSGWSWLLLIFPIYYILMLFPTGRPVSSSWRWAVFYIIIINLLFFLIIASGKNLSPSEGSWSVANPVGFISEDMFQKYLALPFGFGLLSATILSVISMIFRYRHSSITEVQQIKWLLFACSFFAVIYIPAVLVNLNGEVWGINPAWLDLLFPIGVMSLPAAIGIAILRYRLWDINILIRRTIIFSILSVFLLLIYVGSVTLMENIFSWLSGEQSNAAIVISTLFIAAMFTPLRKRIQNSIDHRFYRRKYDSQKTLEAFANKVRNETDVEHIGTELLQVAQKTVQPAHASLWLKPRRRN